MVARSVGRRLLPRLVEGDARQRLPPGAFVAHGGGFATHLDVSLLRDLLERGAIAGLELHEGALEGLGPGHYPRLDHQALLAKLVEGDLHQAEAEAEGGV